MNTCIVVSLLFAAALAVPFDGKLSSYIDLLPRGVPSNISTFYGRNVQITAQESSETIIAQNEQFPNVILASSNFFGPEQWTTVVPGLYYSLDGGATWKESFFPELEEGIVGWERDGRRMRSSEREDPDDGSIGDPTLAWSADGSEIYSAVLANCSEGCDMWFWKSKDFGKTWQGPVGIDDLSDADKPMLHVDTYPTSPFKDTIYIIYDLPSDGNVQVSGFSRDMGKTWSIQTFNTTAGIGGDVSTDKQGRLYYVYPEFQTQTLNVLVSENGGVSFENRGTISATNASFQMHLPAQTTRGVLVYTVVEADNTNSSYSGSVYVLWSDTLGQDQNGNDHARVRIAYSRDQGKTWTIRSPHSLVDSYRVDRFFPWLSIDPKGTGRVHVSFYDTRNFADRSGVDVYYTYSDDGADTWAEPIRMTSASSFPVTWDFDQFGDYEGLSVRHNRVMPVWADNRNFVGPVCVWTSILDIDVLTQCTNFQVSFSVTPLPVKYNKPTVFTASVQGGSGSYTYEWNFSESASVDCSTASCTHTFTANGNTTVSQVSLFVTDNGSSGCYRGAAAWVVPASADEE